MASRHAVGWGLPAAPLTQRIPTVTSPLLAYPWAARGVFPECTVGTSMLGRVMAAPTEQAFREAVNMMNYMHQNKTRGIRFTSQGNTQPVAFCDASNKPDPSDSKCLFGYVHLYMGGPIIFASGTRRSLETPGRRCRGRS